MIKIKHKNKEIIKLACMTIRTKQRQPWEKEKKEEGEGMGSWNRDENSKTDTFKRNKQHCLSRVQS